MTADSLAGTGSEMHALITELFPICRSITGNGLRESLRRLGGVAPISLSEVPTGTRVFDWTVPKEWNIQDAWIEDSAGRRVVDFRNSNLHVVSHSVPVRARMPLAELRQHLHSLPDQPDLIPYRTSYYKEDWGFCLTHRQLETLTDGDYEVCIASTLEPGSLTIGVCTLPGATTDEILVSTHCCHPSLANDNLSGMAVAAYLARYLESQPRRHTFRFLFIPGTIGSITWLAQHEPDARRIRHGLVLSCLGDAGPLTYKRSRRGDALVDRAAQHVLKHAGAHRVIDFIPYGYDERQYCSPGFNLAVGCMTRTRNGEYPEYHTSADDLGLIGPAQLQDSLEKCALIVEVLEKNAVFMNLNPNCEPQLGRRGLYRNTGGVHLPSYEMALLWVLNLSDGGHSLLDIAERSNLPFRTILNAATALEGTGVLRELDSRPATVSH